MLNSDITHGSCGKGIISCELGESCGCFSYHFFLPKKMFWKADEEIRPHYMENPESSQIYLNYSSCNLQV